MFDNAEKFAELWLCCWTSLGYYWLLDS